MGQEKKDYTNQGICFTLSCVMLNIANLQAQMTNLAALLPTLAAKSPTLQPQVDALAEAFNNLNTTAANIVQAPDPGPRTDLDFSKLDAAVSNFKVNRRISQQDADNVAGLI